MSIPVIYYHSIGPVNPYWKRNYLTLDLHFFENQLQYFSKRFITISLHDYFLIRIGRKQHVNKAIVISFDDGYLDNWIWAFPLLKKYGLNATIFVSPEFVDPRPIVRPNLEDVWKGYATMADLEHSGFLSWDEMRIMERSGLISIESHSMSHTKYPVSDKIISFHHPDADNLNTIVNKYPERKYGYIEDNSFNTLIPYGYPIFEDASSVVAKKITINPEFIDACVNALQHQIATEYNFARNIKTIAPIYNQFKDKNLLIINTESDYEYMQRLDYEICQSKQVIEERLNKTVHFLCWPHGDNNVTSHRIAIEAGYLATTVGSKQKFPDAMDRIPMRIGLYHSKNSRMLSMLKAKYKIGFFLKKFPWKQINQVYQLIRYKNLTHQ